MLNRCLDDAVASAITQYGNERDAVTKEKAGREGSRMRVLGAALRVSVSAATVALEAIQSGRVGIAGSTCFLLGRNLQAIADLNDRIQAEMGELAKP